MSAVEEYLLAEFDREWTDLDQRAREAVLVDFSELCANPEHFGYDGAMAFPELAREYHRSIGQGHLTGYVTVLANSGPLYGRADTNQFEMHGRAFLCDLAEEAIDLADPQWLLENPEWYHVRHYANILADGILPECGHAIEYADLYLPQDMQEEYYADGAPDGHHALKWVCTHTSHEEALTLHMTPPLGGREYPGPRTFADPDAKPLLSCMIDAGMQSLAREHLRALAERHIGDKLTQLFIEVPDDAAQQLSAVKLYQHYADILADGILPECGHSVATMDVRIGDRMQWVCNHMAHTFDEVRTGYGCELPYTSTLLGLN